MGNIAAKKAVDIKALTSELKFVSKKEDPRYGQISLFENKTTGEIVVYKEIISKSTTEFKKEIENLAARCGEGQTSGSKNLDTPNIVKVIGFATQTHDNLCSNFYKIALVTEYIEQDLETEIEAKKKAKEFYTEEKIWQLLESLVSALSAMHRENITANDIKPISVFVTKDGVYKLADPVLVSSHSAPGYFQRLSGYDDVRPYLSPELLKGLESDEYYPKHDGFKSDIFAAGLTILHAASLESCEAFYNWDDNTFSVEALAQRFQTIRNLYSENLLNLVRKMVVYEEINRPSAAEVVAELNQLDWRRNAQNFVKKLTYSEAVGGRGGEETIVAKHNVLQNDRAHVVHSANPEDTHKVEPQREIPKSTLREEVEFQGEEEKHQQPTQQFAEKSTVRMSNPHTHLGQQPDNHPNQTINSYRNNKPQNIGHTHPQPQLEKNNKAQPPATSTQSSGTRTQTNLSPRTKKPVSTIGQGTTTASANRTSPGRSSPKGSPIKKQQSPRTNSNLPKNQPSRTQKSPRQNNQQAGRATSPRREALDKAKPTLDSRNVQSGTGQSSEPYVYKRSPEVEKIISEIMAKSMSAPANQENNHKPLQLGSPSLNYSSNVNQQGKSIQKSGVGATDQEQITSYTLTANPYKTEEKIEIVPYKYTPDALVQSILERYRDKPIGMPAKSKINILCFLSIYIFLSLRRLHA